MEGLFDRMVHMWASDDGYHTYEFSTCSQSLVCSRPMLVHQDLSKPAQLTTKNSQTRIS